VHSRAAGLPQRLGGAAPAVIALLALAWVAALAAGPLLPVPVAGLLYAAGSFICHQMSDRSFHVGAFQLPVCARCFGLYAGGAVGSLAAALAGEAFRRRLLAAEARRRYIWTAVAALPTVLTLVLEHGFGWPLSNDARAIAALPLAAVVGLVVTSAVPTLH
jgi:hypothetical protein